MPWIKSFNGFLDFLSLVIVHAPDDFPKEEYLRDDEQLTLERAFKELRDGMVFVQEMVANGAALIALRGQLDQALDVYRKGDDVNGARVLQDFEQLLLRQARPQRPR